MTFANNFDLDEAVQNVRPHLGFKLFDTQDFISAKKLNRKVIFLQIIENQIEQIYWVCKEMRPQSS